MDNLKKQIKEEAEQNKELLRNFMPALRTTRGRKLEELTEAEYQFLLEEYIETSYERRFLCDEANIMNCGKCPYNNTIIPAFNQLPCGQQRCWVIVHTEE